MNDVMERVRKLRPIDDVFFEKIAEDLAVCQEMLRVILENPTLEVISVTPQKSIKNLWGRSVRLDALCRLADGTLCNVEVQKSDNDDHARRVRYNEACITANNTQVGERFIHVPDVTMVYISTFDMFGQKRTCYHCRTMVDETGIVVDNGLLEIYVNTTIKDGSTISELMECFLQEQIDNEKFPRLSQRVKYLKDDEGGKRIMCDIVEEYARELFEEERKNMVLKMLKRGMSINDICDIAECDEEYINQLKQEKK